MSQKRKSASSSFGSGPKMSAAEGTNLKKIRQAAAPGVKKSKIEAG